MSYKVKPKRVSSSAYTGKLYGASINFARERKRMDSRVSINATANNIFSDALKNREVANYLLKNYYEKV